MTRLSVVFGFVILGLALLVGAAETQDAKKDTGKAKGQLPPGWKTLNLSPTQLDSIYSVQKEYKIKIADLSKQIKDLQMQEKLEMSKVLTEDQKAKLIEITTGEKKDAKKADEKKADEKKTDEKK